MSESSPGRTPKGLSFMTLAASELWARQPLIMHGEIDHSFDSLDQCFDGSVVPGNVSWPKHPLKSIFCSPTGCSFRHFSVSPYKL